MFVRRLVSSEKGASAVEYGLIAALIAVAAIASIQGVGTNLRTTLNSAAAAPEAAGKAGMQVNSQ